MCGIVGYVGPREASAILIGGLRRLEYRGYDSAGIATLTGDGQLEIRRAVGKLDNLRRMLEESPVSGHIGIGHTRWATHGRPSETNAHPHKAGPVAVIHNGIIENYVALREMLLKRGHKLKSETDTELISHLIEERLKGEETLTAAVRAAVSELRGSFSIVVMSETEPDKLVVAKTATPLVLGLGDGENFVASDIPAILEHTRRALVLEDGELAEITAHSVALFAFDGTPVERAQGRVWQDWQELAYWYDAQRGSGPEQLRAAAGQALGQLITNAKRLLDSSGTGFSRRADFLRLARWFSAVDDEGAHQLYAAAFGAYPARHLLFGPEEPDPRIDPMTSWRDSDPVSVPVSLRERGDRIMRGRSSRVPDPTADRLRLTAEAQREADAGARRGGGAGSGLCLRSRRQHHAYPGQC